MSSASDFPGTFPSIGPVTYLPLAPHEVRDLMKGEPPIERTWFHATHERAARAACRQGLIPSCWTGGDSCCVFGYDDMDQIPIHRGEWVLEVLSHALESQLKAWWVPATAISGVWRRGRFTRADALRVPSSWLSAPSGSCACDLADLTTTQIKRWRTTWS